MFAVVRDATTEEIKMMDYKCLIGINGKMRVVLNDPPGKQAKL